MCKKIDYLQSTNFHHHDKLHEINKEKQDTSHNLGDLQEKLKQMNQRARTTNELQRHKDVKAKEKIDELEKKIKQL